MSRGLWIAVRCAAGALAIVVAAGGNRQPRAFAQTSPTDFDALAADADKASASQQWDAATALYQSIRRLAHDRDDAFWEARGRYGLGVIASARGQYDEARALLIAALEQFDRLHSTTFVGEVSAALGALAYSLGNDRESVEHYRRAVDAFEAVGNRSARAHALFGRLTVEPIDDFSPARERVYDDLLGDARALRDEPLEASILHSWGDRLFARNEYARANETLELAASVAERAGEREQLARIYTSLGRLYRVHGQSKAAVRYQLKALELTEKSSSPRVRVQSLNAVGVAYQSAGDYAKAREYYERALAAAEQIGSAPMIDFLRADLGGLLVLAGDAERARVLLEGVLARGIEQHRSARYEQLSTAYSALGRYEDARAAAQQALDSCHTGEPFDCVYGRLSLAKADLALGHEAAALARQEAALKDIEEIHGKLVATDFLKQEFFHLWEPSYSLAIELRFRRSEFRDALEKAELARSRAFVDLLASHDIKTDRVPQLAALTVRGSPTTTIRSSTAADAPDAAAVSAIAARLHSTLIEYWVASDRIYIWVVAADGAVTGAAVTIQSSRLDQLIRATSPFVGPAEAGVHATVLSRGNVPIALTSRTPTAWRELYDLLVTPIERDLPRESGALLTIVPHGPLLHLPFAALRDAKGRYLVERYTIHSIPAAGVLQFTRGRHHPNARAGSLLLVADPVPTSPIPGEPPLPRLPGAVDEVRAVSRLVPAPRTAVLTATHATEPRVRDALRERAVVHFATHAIVRDGDPMASFLALGAAPGGDGRLTAETIYGLKLDAELVVLSACRSGDGLVTGDGVASLARAFFYAGAPSVVVSVWDVADVPTSRVLPAFYRAWLGGADKARALRLAQLEMIRDLRGGRVKVKTAAGEITIPEAPAFWAGFVLLGEPE